MKPFPPEKDLAFLRGLTLCAVALGPYQIDLNFDGNTIINVEHVLHYIDEAGFGRRYDIQNEIEPVAFHSLIRDQAAIEDFSIEGPHLILLFSKGRKLIVERDDGPHESGHIMHNGDVIVF